MPCSLYFLCVGLECWKCGLPPTWHAGCIISIAWLWPHCSERGCRPQGTIGGLLVMGSCVKMADGAWARGEIEEDGTWRLELAGYDISQIPLARILRGQLLGWPPETLREPVPNA
jgi:hypothetical protein